MTTWRLIGWCAGFIVSGWAHADDRATLEGTTVFGNRDLPNITFVVPWKDDALDLLSLQPPQALFEQQLLPLDRAHFQRGVTLFTLQQDALSVPRR